MCLLFETIKVLERKLINIDYHNQRLNRTRKLLFGVDLEIDLNTVISVPDFVDGSLYKCRIGYNEKGLGKPEFSPYTIQKINSLKIVRSYSVDYSFKYNNRSSINELLSKKECCDDVLIIKDGFVTDTSICNIVFFDGDQWLTPSTPLLRGTKREKLLQENIIYEKLIMEEDIQNFNKAALINTFRDLEDNQFPVQNIITY